MHEITYPHFNVCFHHVSREGLNLMPMEYVYARKDLEFAGVVVASEFTACSSLLSGALKVVGNETINFRSLRLKTYSPSIRPQTRSRFSPRCTHTHKLSAICLPSPLPPQVNPFYTLDVADKLHVALAMTPKESRQRNQRDLPFVGNYPSSKWTGSILKDLDVNTFTHISFFFSAMVYRINLCGYFHFIVSSTRIQNLFDFIVSLKFWLLTKFIWSLDHLNYSPLNSLFFVLVI